MAVIDGYQLEETIKEFRFNELGGISILKKWRELAVICQIDIEIVSISRDNYRNYASIPAHGFYGYATIILRDFALPSIKITQPRQTLYYARNDAALANWFTFLQSARAQANYKAIESLICFNTGLLGGACVVVPCKDIPAFRFDEIPLREVMVKADYGTQFKIEYSFWNLLPELNACGDIVTPKSGQLDGGKDSGLPPNGSSPQNGSPNNPYGGLLPADGIDKEGVLSPSKLNNQDNSNPDNAPNFQIDRMATTSQEGYYLELNALSCASLFNISPQRVGNYRWFIPSYSDSRIRVTSNALFDDHTCTRRDLERVYYDIFSPTNGVTLTRTDLLYLPISAEVKYGFLPTNQNFDGVPYP